MPNDTHETAPTRFVLAGDVLFAYRRFGPRGATPLLLLNYFAAHMDDWDPKITNGLPRSVTSALSTIGVSAGRLAKRRRRLRR